MILRGGAGRSGTPAWYARGTVRGVIRTPIEWAAKTIQSERMRLGELLRRVGEKRVPDVELAIR
ncbi:hypothetical protein GCM10008937_02430 [Deinococcus depolymerans]|uniref:Uncharacterized protein n=1 Tax=Deinococcus depolymerans TaxID=392408 RepID=A0ABP3LEK2_9DEIO